METLTSIQNNVFMEQLWNKATLFQGNNLFALRSLPENSIDSVVTDPPYGISYLNNTWDIQVPTVEFWREVYRVLKPGGHVLSFSSARTYHRMTINIEDAGFEIRDQIMWMYGQGMPKSQNIGIEIDKIQGNKRSIVEVKQVYKLALHTDSKRTKVEYTVTQGNSEWEGWGTGLKPAHEPICVARKPIEKLTIAKNVIEFGTGALNIQESKIESEDQKFRYPTNVIFDSSSLLSLQIQNPTAHNFFYVPKPSVKEKTLGFTNGKNNHPTVKPVSLMSYLCKLVTPVNGVILDPFMGSGTTGVSALCCGFNFMGMELGDDYFQIAKKRISEFNLYTEFIKSKPFGLNKVSSLKKKTKKKLIMPNGSKGFNGIWNNLPLINAA